MGNKSEKKEKTIMFILVVIGLIVLILCIFCYLKYQPKDTEIVLVKDMQNNSGRIISNKTEGLNLSSGSVLIKGEIPEGLLNPDDVFKEDDLPPIEENTNGRVDVVIGSKKEEKPLFFSEAGSLVDTLKIEAIAEEEEDSESTLSDILNEAKIKRNEGRVLVSYSFSFMNHKGQFITFETLNTDGLAIIPFELTNPNSLEFLKSLEPIYTEYKDKVDFVFLNISFDAMETYDKILSKFEDLQIPKDYPIFYDSTLDFVSANNIKKSTGCIFINLDNYIREVITTQTKSEVIYDSLNEMLKENQVFKNENNKILANTAD